MYVPPEAVAHSFIHIQVINTKACPSVFSKQCDDTVNKRLGQTKLYSERG